MHDHGDRTIGARDYGTGLGPHPFRLPSEGRVGLGQWSMQKIEKGTRRCVGSS